MTAKKMPNNTDIIVALTELRKDSDSKHEESHKELSAIKEQVIKTNGRVLALEKRSYEEDAVERYKLSNPQQASVNRAETVVFQAPKWFQNERLVAGVVAFLLASAAVLGFFAGGK